MPYIVKLASDGPKALGKKATTNLKPMFDYAMGRVDAIEGLDNQITGLCYSAVAQGVVNIFDPRYEREFDKLTPSNGYGSLTDAREFMLHLLAMITKSPGDVFVVSAVENTKPTVVVNNKPLQSQQQQMQH